MVTVAFRASLLPFGTQVPREQLVQGLLLWSRRVEASGAPFEFKCGVAGRVFSGNLSCSWGLNTSCGRRLLRHFRSPPREGRLTQKGWRNEAEGHWL